MSSKLSSRPNCFGCSYFSQVHASVTNWFSWGLAPTYLPEVMPGVWLSARGWDVSQRLAVWPPPLHSVWKADVWDGGAMSMRPAIRLLRVPEWTINHSACTLEDTDLPSLRPMTSGLRGPGNSRTWGCDLAPTPTALDQKPGSGRQTAPWADNLQAGPPPCHRPGFHSFSSRIPCPSVFPSLSHWAPSPPPQVPTAHPPPHTLPGTPWSSSPWIGWIETAVCETRDAGSGSSRTGMKRWPVWGPGYLLPYHWPGSWREMSGCWSGAGQAGPPPHTHPSSASQKGHRLLTTQCLQMPPSHQEGTAGQRRLPPWWQDRTQQGSRWARPALCSNPMPAPCPSPCLCTHLSPCVDWGCTQFLRPGAESTLFLQKVAFLPND